MRASSRAIALSIACVVTGCSLMVDLDGYTSGGTLAGGDGGTSSGGGEGGASSSSGGDGGGSSSGDAAANVDVLLAGGGHQMCGAIGARLACWGSNSDGQLGDGTKQNRFAPVPVVALPTGNVEHLGVGELHACAVIGGDAYCWGQGGSGELGDGNKAQSSAPVKVKGLVAGKTTDVSAGTGFSCAVSDGGAYCWGTNGVSQLGIGTTTPGPGTATAVTTGSGTLTGITQIACGQDHACARASSGDVWCWGHNDNGTLATSTTAAGSPSQVAHKVEGLPGSADQVVMAGWHACAIVAGSVWCWGRGDSGLLGNGGNSDSATPVAAAGLTGVAFIATGGGATDSDATCALRGTDLLCWGNDQYGRLGDGATAARSVPNPVGNLPKNIKRAAGGYDHFCAAMTDGTVMCWGKGGSGELGDGTGMDRLAPVVVKPF